jgi:SAM-dependent methyltransferase
MTTHDPDVRWAISAQFRANFLEQTIPKGGIGVELGVYKGFFSRVILDTLAPEKLHMIDPWYLLGEKWELPDGDQSTVGALMQTLQRCATELVSGQAVLHIGSDLDVLPTFPNDHFDWAYVDSLHTYEHAKKELAILAKKVKPGGIIAGDDWTADPEHPYHGVCRAVREFVNRQPYEFIYEGDSDAQWAIRSKQEMG